MLDLFDLLVDVYAQLLSLDLSFNLSFVAVSFFNANVSPIALEVKKARTFQTSSYGWVLLTLIGLSISEL